MTGTAIQKVVFSSGESPQVIGVEMNDVQEKDSPIRSCWTRGEVILCAGTVGTPQLLMLSGVGPREDLQKLDISVVKDMPMVGRHVIDVRRRFSLLRAQTLITISSVISAHFSTFHPAPFDSAPSQV